MTKKIQDISDHARALSALGSRKGGEARAAAMTPEARSAAARLAVRARWDRAKAIPTASHVGMLRIGDVEIDCAVLDDAEITRVLSQRGLSRGLGASLPSRRGRTVPVAVADLPPFLWSERLQPFISNDLAASLKSPILYRLEGTGRHSAATTTAHGYDARLLPKICGVWLDARRAGKLTKAQKHIAGRAEQLVAGLANVGILALVDEATGYQYDRAREDLQKILAAHIREELRPWVRVFPHEFFKQIYRVHGWDYREGKTRHPQYVGKLVNKLIYGPLPPPVLIELRERNPVTNGRRRHKHHQYLTDDTGIPHLDRQIAVATVVLTLSKNPKDMQRKFSAIFSAPSDQLELLSKTDEEE